MRKQIDRFPNYLVSNFGKVKRNEKLVRPFVNKNSGQLRVTLQSNGTKKNFLISRLVYCTFNNIDVMYNGKDLICHKDDNLNNNRLSNLFIGTQSDNMCDCRNKGRLKVPTLKGELNPNGKLTTEKVLEIFSLHRQGVLGKELAKQFGVSTSTISSILNGRSRNRLN